MRPRFPRGSTPGNSWWGCAARFFKSWPDFRPKNIIIHTRFQTRPLKSTPVFRPSLWAEIMLSSLRLGRKHKHYYLNLFGIHIFLSFLLIWNLNDNNVHTLPKFPRKPNPIPDQNGKSVHRFQTNGAKTLPDGTYLYDLYKGVPPRDFVLQFSPKID